MDITALCPVRHNRYHDAGRAVGMGEEGDGEAGQRESGSREPATSGAVDDESGVSQAFDAKLYAGSVSFGREDATLLRAIDDAGSLNAAAAELGRSYSRVQKRLRVLEGAFGALVESRRGGAGGGGSALTDGARRLLAKFQRLRTEFSGVTAVTETVIEGRVVGRDGELAVVETAAGRLRARAPFEATDVSITVRSDSVTLHAVDTAPGPAETSARNRFRGTVVGLDERESIVSVSLDVGFDRPLVALITAESSRELDIDSGAPAVASFKTTATRASPRE
jgi:molybdate transport system regulatory protein